MSIRRWGAAIVTALVAYAVGSLSAQTAPFPQIAELILVDNARGQVRDIGPIERHGTIDHAQVDATNLTIRADAACAGRYSYIDWKIENETNGWRKTFFDRGEPWSPCGNFSSGRSFGCPRDLLYNGEITLIATPGELGGGKGERVVRMFEIVNGRAGRWVRPEPSRIEPESPDPYADSWCTTNEDRVSKQYNCGTGKDANGRTLPRPIECCSRGYGFLGTREDGLRSHMEKP